MMRKHFEQLVDYIKKNEIENTPNEKVVNDFIKTLDGPEQLAICENLFGSLTVSINKWADAKGLLKKENAPKQFMKIMEELGETSQAFLKDKHFDLADGIGDVFVTLIIFAYQNNLHPAICLLQAWNEIKDRTGEMKDGVFVKSEDLN